MGAITDSSARPQRLTVLAVGHYPPHPGGVALSCSALFHGMATRGHRVHLIAEGPPGCQSYDREHTGAFPAGFSLSRFPSPRFRTEHHRPDELRSARETCRAGLEKMLPPLLDSLNPDVLVACHEALCAPVAEYAALLGLPCVFLLRGSPTWQIAQNVAAREVEREHLATLQQADLVIPVGRYMQICLQQRGLTRVRHISNFVALEKFRPLEPDSELRRQHSIPENAVIALHPSTMQPRKRSQDIIKSAVRTLEHNPNLIYVFLGGGQYRDELERLCRNLGLSQHFRFVPDVAYELMPRYYSIADIVLLSSEGEGLARVYMEAQACARTLVVSDIPAAREVIRHGETGLLFRMGDIADLAHQTLLAASDGDLRARIGRQALAESAQFDLDRAVDEYVREFARVAAGPVGVCGDSLRQPDDLIGDTFTAAAR